MKTQLLAALLAIFTISCSCSHHEPTTKESSIKGRMENLPTNRWEASHINLVLFGRGPAWRYYAGAGTALRAADTWNKTGVGPRLLVHAPDPAFQPETLVVAPDGTNGIYFVDNNWILDKNITGYTFIVEEEGVIVEVDIVLNAEHYLWGFGDLVAKNEMDMESILLHEMGHALGLNHVGSRNAIMHTFAKKGLRTRTVHPEDLAQLEYLYPPEVEKPLVADSNALFNFGELLKSIF